MSAANAIKNPASIIATRVPRYLITIRVWESLYALPFCFMGMILAADGWPGWSVFIWITVALTGVRTLGMAANRFLHRKEDVHNPRTAERHLPTGKLHHFEVLGLMVVGCGEVENGAYKHRPKQTTTAKPVKELTAEEKKVVGVYELELKKFGETQRYVLLDNSTVEYYLNGKKEEAEHKWSIVDKEVHIERENRAVSVFSINKDESITGIATIDEDGKRKEILKEHQYTRGKIK